MKSLEIIKLICAIALPLAAGAIGSFFTMPAIPEWYATLTKPELAPPNWVFGPVWTTLYVLMGVAFFLVWRRGFTESGVRLAAGIFIFQLILNTAWSIVFFNLRSPGGALIVIVFLWTAILITMFSFARFSRLAAWLLVPYLAWVSFASYLNYAIWTLNP